MRSYTAVMAFRQRLGALVAPAPVAAPPAFEHFFPDSTWAAESRIREAVDGLVYSSRWRVVWLPVEAGAPSPRTFYLRGTHAQVMARAHAFFTVGIVVVDPAPFGHDERIDRRLNTSGRVSNVR